MTVLFFCFCIQYGTLIHSDLAKAQRWGAVREGGREGSEALFTGNDQAVYTDPVPLCWNFAGLLV